MKYLNGLELAGYIKERQANQIRRLKQQYNIQPKLAILSTVNDPVIDIYLSLKKKYGQDIDVDVELSRVNQADLVDYINKLNKDVSVQGIVLQLPLKDPSQTDKLVNLVSPTKDVDGLGDKSKFDPATPTAILWLLSGYNVDLLGKDIVIVGSGRLVGKPLEQVLIKSGLFPRVLDKSTPNVPAEILKADIVISATGQPSLIKPAMLKKNAVVIDAGVASEDGKTVGDVDRKVYKERDDLTITPLKGGVGPLTVTSLFDNFIKAVLSFVEQ